MGEQSTDEVVLRRYLLADIDEKQRDALEERLLSDDDFAETLSLAQSSLIDDYVFNALSPTDRQLFEKNFILNDERKKDLLLSQAFDIYSEPKTKPVSDVAEPKDKRSWWTRFLSFIQTHKVEMAFSLATVVLLAFFTPDIFRWIKSRVSIDESRASIERRIAEYNRRPFTTQSLSLRSQELSLQPTLLRGGSELQRIEITAGVELVNLKLDLIGPQYGQYSAVVKTVEGNELFSVDGLMPEEKQTVLLRIPSEFLTSNDYQVALIGIAPDGGRKEVAAYNLRVIKRS